MLMLILVLGDCMLGECILDVSQRMGERRPAIHVGKGKHEKSCVDRRTEAEQRTSVWFLMSSTPFVVVIADRCLMKGEKSKVRGRHACLIPVFLVVLYSRNLSCPLVMTRLLSLKKTREPLSSVCPLYWVSRSAKWIIFAGECSMLWAGSNGESNWLPVLALVVEVSREVAACWYWR